VPRGKSGRSSERLSTPADAFAADAGAFTPLRGQGVRVSGVGVTPAQVALQATGKHGVVAVVRCGGRIGVSDVAAEDRLTPAERGNWVRCIAGALFRTEYLDGLTAVGFTDVTVGFTSEYAVGMHAAIMRAHRP